MTKVAFKVTKFALAIGVMVAASSAMAATDSANLTIGASVVNACAIGPGAIAFGSLGLAVNAGVGTLAANGNNDAHSGVTISIVCTNGASATIGGDLGANAAGSVRNMISGADLLAYELYTDAGRTTVLDTASGSIAYTGTGAATTADKIYARVTAAQLAAAKKGTYSDTVGLTITYTP